MDGWMDLWMVALETDVSLMFHRDFSSGLGFSPF
jgi:hypothetical protein